MASRSTMSCSRHGAIVTATVDGLAASIASVIIMAAAEISVTENGIVMIHNRASFIGVDANEMRGAWTRRKSS